MTGTDSPRTRTHERCTQAAVAHIGVTVADLDRAVDWYQSVLGFDVLIAPITVCAADGAAGAQAAAVFGTGFGSMRQAQLVDCNGFGLELFEFRSPPTEPDRTAFDYWRPGPFHICVRDPDVAGLAQRISDTGGHKRTDIHRSFPDEPYEWCYCEDPFGNIVEIYSHSHERVYANRTQTPATSSQSQPGDPF